MRVTESQGNLVQSLDGLNPSRLLLSAIEKNNNSEDPTNSNASMAQITKDDQFYLAVLHDNDGNSEMSQLYHITSGDPSRGTLALESEAAPPHNAIVQIFRLPATASPDTLSRYMNSPTSTSRNNLKMAFTVAASDAMPTDAFINGGANTVILSDTFLTASENGFLVVRHSENDPKGREWLCKVPGGSIDLRWNV